MPRGAEYRNLVALHSLSKSCGIAALRVGFACGSPAIIERLKRVTGPYDINQFGVVAANAVLDDWASMQGYAREVECAKAFVLQHLQARGVRHYSGGGNFLLVWPGEDVTAVEAALRERGILVRSMHGKPMLSGCFRLSVGTLEQMKRFTQEFDAVLGR